MPTRTPPPLYLGTEYYGSDSIGDKYSQSLGSWDIFAGADGHYGYPDFPLDRNVGGPFLVKGDKTTYDPIPVGEIWRGGTLNQRYVGKITAAQPGTAGVTTQADGFARGAEAFAKMRPTRPMMQLTNSIVELKDLKDMFDGLYEHKEGIDFNPVARKKRALNAKKDVGSTYLAYRFGWAPIFEDIVNFFYQRKRVQKKIDFLLRNNGKPVRTTIKLLDVTGTPVVSNGSLYTAFTPSLVTQYYKTQPRFTDTFTNGERWWASARWQIHLPRGSGPSADKDLANELYASLYGHYITLASVYKLIPWSWLADWFGNQQYLLENFEATWDSRTAADYCYIMRYNYNRRQYHVEGDFVRRSGEVVHVNSTSVRENFYKSRLMADPFGFSTNQNSLSSTQLAILGALGMSRVR